MFEWSLTTLRGLIHVWVMTSFQAAPVNSVLAGYLLPSPVSHLGNLSCMSYSSNPYSFFDSEIESLLQKATFIILYPPV